MAISVEEALKQVYTLSSHSKEIVPIENAFHRVLPKVLPHPIPSPLLTTPLWTATRYGSEDAGKTLKQSCTIFAGIR
jgi:molybdopterin molybdotransferase